MTSTSTNTFTVASFNIWAPCWNPHERDNVYYKEETDSSWWESRQDQILSLLAGSDNSLNCDIYCLQEFWCDNEKFCEYYSSYLLKYNYILYYLPRTSQHKPDGIAIIINKNRFNLLNLQNIGYSLSNRVAQIALIQSKENKNFKLIISNTHLTYPANPLFDGNLRDLQIRELLHAIDYYQTNGFNKDKNNNNNNDNDNVSDEKEDVVGSLLFGDFNCNIDGNCAQRPQNDGFTSSYHYFKVLEKYKKDSNSSLQNNNNNNNNTETVDNGNDSNFDLGVSLCKDIDNIDLQKEYSNLKFISHESHEGKQSGCDFVFYKNYNNDKGCLEIMDSYLHPKSLNTDKFPHTTEWSVSDHRPLVTTFKMDNKPFKQINNENNNNNNNNNSCSILGNSRWYVLSKIINDIDDDEIDTATGSKRSSMTASNIVQTENNINEKTCEQCIVL